MSRLLFLSILLTIAALCSANCDFRRNPAGDNGRPVVTAATLSIGDEEEVVSTYDQEAVVLASTLRRRRFSGAFGRRGGFTPAPHAPKAFARGFTPIARNRGFTSIARNRGGAKRGGFGRSRTSRRNRGSTRTARRGANNNRGRRGGARGFLANRFNALLRVAPHIPRWGRAIGQRLFKAPTVKGFTQAEQQVQDFWWAQLKQGNLITPDGKCAASCDWFLLTGSNLFPALNPQFLDPDMICAECQKRWIVYDGPCYEFPQAFQNGQISPQLASEVKSKCGLRGECICSKIKITQQNIGTIRVKKRGIKGAFKAVFKALGKSFKAVGKAIKKTFKAVGKAFKGVGKAVKKVFRGIGRGLRRLFRRRW